MREPEKPICIWVEDEEGIFETSCNEMFGFADESGPKENGFNYCPYCGCELVERGVEDK